VPILTIDTAIKPSIREGKGNQPVTSLNLPSRLHRILATAAGTLSTMMPSVPTVKLVVVAGAVVITVSAVMKPTVLFGWPCRLTRTLAILSLSSSS